MVQHAATVQSVKARTIRHSIALSVASISVLVFADVCLATLAFLLSYVIRQDAPIFVWSQWQELPIGIAADFQPYFNILLFVPLVKIWSLRRYGFYKLRGEFSFSGDLFRIIRAST